MQLALVDRRAQWTVSRGRGSGRIRSSVVARGRLGPRIGFDGSEGYRSPFRGMRASDFCLQSLGRVRVRRISGGACRLLWSRKPLARFKILVAEAWNRVGGAQRKLWKLAKGNSGSFVSLIQGEERSLTCRRLCDLAGEARGHCGFTHNVKHDFGPRRLTRWRSHIKPARFARAFPSIPHRPLPTWEAARQQARLPPGELRRWWRLTSRASVPASRAAEVAAVRPVGQEEARPVPRVADSRHSFPDYSSPRNRDSFLASVRAPERLPAERSRDAGIPRLRNIVSCDSPLTATQERLSRPELTEE